MQDRSDAELLREFAAQANEAAFRELVTRHADLVYASALRQVRSPELARDIAQTVFGHLVRKAPALGKTLAENASLVGWLYRTTRYEANTQMRDNRRRQARERQAMENFDTNSETATEWERIAPMLDEAMADLSDEDREALLLRYFKNHDFRAVGVSLGVSDDAAQKRVSRALERLRAGFNRRGVTTTAVALSAAVSANAVSAPAGLAATLSTAALAGTTLTIAATTATATKAIAMTTLQKTLITATIAAAVGTATYEAYEASRLRGQDQVLQRQNVKLATLTAENARFSNQITVAGSLQSLSNDQLRELLRLRGEVGVLRRENERLAKALKQIEAKKATNDSTGAEVVQDPQQWDRPGKFLPKEILSDVGTSNPAKAMQTYLWAKMQNNFDMMRQVLSDNLTNEISRLGAEFRAAMVDAKGIEFRSELKSTVNPIVQPLLNVVGPNNSSIYEHLGLKLEGQTWKVYYDDWSPAPYDSVIWHPH